MGPEGQPVGGQPSPYAGNMPTPQNPFNYGPMQQFLFQDLPMMYPGVVPGQGDPAYTPSWIPPGPGQQIPTQTGMAGYYPSLLPGGSVPALGLQQAQWAMPSFLGGGGGTGTSPTGVAEMAITGAEESRAQHNLQSALDYYGDAFQNVLVDPMSQMMSGAMSYLFPSTGYNTPPMGGWTPSFGGPPVGETQPVPVPGTIPYPTAPAPQQQNPLGGGGYLPLGPAMGTTQPIQLNNLARQF